VIALIFDLDNCLAPSDEAGRSLFDPVFEAVRLANHGRLADDEVERAFEDTWRLPFDDVAERYGFTDEMKQAGWRAFCGVEVTVPMRGYGDLDLLPRLGDQRFLVTSGFRRLQESKVRALGFAPLFAEIVVDAIDEPGHLGKEGVFAELLRRWRLEPPDVWAVGDNPDSELAAGRRLGMRPVQMVRPGVEPSDEVELRVRDLAGLMALLAGHQTRGASG
jgi:putative hydrolase of the HAD superfamily